MAIFRKYYDNVAYMGRHILHDPASKAYAFDASGVTVQSVRHSRRIPVLNQGQIGSCTGNAMTGLLGTAEFFDALPEGVLSTTDAAVDEQFAVDLYSLATQIDSFAGTYPPQDTGSNGLSVAKSAQQKGWISGYQHTFDFNSFLAALTLQPVIAGIDWYSSFETPAADGLIQITSQAYVEGGHEIVIDELDVENQRVWFTNSWDVTWGVQGRACFSYADFEALLADQGDVVVPVALTKPAPTPVVPTPVVAPVTPGTPTPDDVALWADIQKWAKSKGLI